MFTENTFERDGSEKVGDGTSFVFKLRQDDVEVFPHVGDGKPETISSSVKVFAMHDGPSLTLDIHEYGNTSILADANLGKYFKPHEESTRKTILCGEEKAYVEKFEIFQVLP